MLNVFLRACSKYLQVLRNPYLAFYRISKPIKVQRVLLRPTSLRIPFSLSLYARNLYNNSLVKLAQRTAEIGGAYQRPNTLLRAYNGIAGSVRLNQKQAFPSVAHVVDINRISTQRSGSWYQTVWGSICRPSTWITDSSSLIPRKLIGSGCNSAVWAVDIAGAPTEDLAVKVLYNYYTTGEGTGDTLLRRQLDREFKLRPSSAHPNIVSLVGGFLDKVPAVDVISNISTDSLNSSATASSQTLTVDVQHDSPISGNKVSSDSTLTPNKNGGIAEVHEQGRRDNVSSGWVGADAFPEGFGECQRTYYLLMPRYDATLGDLLSGAWHTVSVNEGEGRTALSTPMCCSTEAKRNTEAAYASHNTTNSISEGDKATGASTAHSPPHTPVPSVRGHHELCPRGRSPNTPLSVEHSVALLAQLFDAVAELERIGVAHRDIKPNNILLRNRLPRVLKRHTSAPCCSDGCAPVELVNSREVLAVNPGLHAALTDFGCATRTSATAGRRPSSLLGRLLAYLYTSHQEEEEEVAISHSGNIALLAPEVAVKVMNCEQNSTLTRVDYARADIWSVATLAYPLFGRANPFLDETLRPVDYSETDLPALPTSAPGVVHWLVHQCLRRQPCERPPADLVADVLHTWSLVRLLHRRLRSGPQTPLAEGRDYGRGSPGQLLPKAEPCISKLPNHSGPVHSLATHSLPAGDIDPTVSTVDTNKRSGIRESQRWSNLHSLLNVFWASDWLLGPAQPPDGLRVSFYRRITLPRLATCLRMVINQEFLWASQVPSSLLIELSLLANRAD